MLQVLKSRFNFALASGTITVLGLMVGLYSTTQAKIVVVGGIITIAIADAFSDALGFYISSKGQIAIQKKLPLLISTISSFLFKFLFILTFILPTMLFSLKIAVIIGIFWGLLIIGAISYNLAKSKNENPCSLILEHIVIALIVIFLTYYAGQWVSLNFGNTSIN